jgi:hypothetical protein
VHALASCTHTYCLGQYTHRGRTVRRSRPRRPSAARTQRLAAHRVCSEAAKLTPPTPARHTATTSTIAASRDTCNDAEQPLSQTTCLPPDRFDLNLVDVPRPSGVRSSRRLRAAFDATDSGPEHASGRFGETSQQQSQRYSESTQYERPVAL